MPQKCCVPNCRGNYRKTKEHAEENVSVFRFPKDPEIRAKWIRMIPREGLEVGDKTVVCEKHFVPEFILRVDTATRADGSILTVQRKNPKVAPDAYPSLFPNNSAYLSSEPPKKRKSPDERLAEQSARDNETFQKWMQEDEIVSFDELLLKTDDFIKKQSFSHWITLRDNNCLCIYTVDLVDKPRITTAVKVLRSLNVEVYRGESHISSSSLTWILGKQCLLKSWSQLSSVLSHFSTDVGHLSVKEQVEVVKQDLIELKEMITDSDDYGADVLARLTFLCEQMSLLFASKMKYSPDTLCIAFRFFAASATVYRRLRDTILTLPSVSYLKRLSTVFSLSGGLNENAHVVYLKQKAQTLKDHERHVILLLDEIYVEPKASFKGGCITGKASNSPLEEATTVQTYMISSLFSPNKDVAAMVPVKNLTAAYLKDCTLPVIKMLESLGYLVCCLISDNNRVNRNMFTELCGGTLKPFVQHPCSSDRKLFFLFDSVHLLKCVRNNWLGQSDAENTFIFPDMNDGTVCKASLCHLRALYQAEKDSIVRMAPSLSYKALYPSNIERQNVKLVLKLFNEKTLAALNHYGVQNQCDVSGTSKFISIILRFWKVLNVKSTGKGHRKRDNDLDPIRSVDDENVRYLRDVLSWLEAWEGLKQKTRHGRFSNETLFALKHTVGTFVELINYLFLDMKVHYVLTGKFQTDCLEFRFSQYRQLSGANFHVSVQELKESEKKLKIVSILHVVSASHGEITLKDFIVQAADNVDNSLDVKDGIVQELLTCCKGCDDVEITESESQSLVFIAGYVGFKLVQNKIVCELCKRELVYDNTLNYEVSSSAYSYLSEIDRGGLKWPKDFLVEIVTQAFKVFKMVVSKECETKFLSVGNQRKSLIWLVTEQLKKSGAVDGECTCGASMLSLAQMTLSYVANIFLNNYCKKVADTKTAGKQKATRKLKTLTH